MKYIRTKYGKSIIDVSKLKYVGEDENDYFFCKVYKNGKESKVVKCFTKKVITKVADTIEELCDVIVCRNELFYPLTSNREGNEFDWEEINSLRTSACMSEEEYNKIKETTNDFEPYFYKVFGAIWTDRGLIYVAKMNDKGEFELL